MFSKGKSTMKKIASLLCAALIAAAAVIPASAASTDKWIAGNGYLIDGKNSPVTVKETDKGIQVSHGGYYVDGINWGGVAYSDKVDLDGFSVEITIDKLPDTDDDTWFSVDFLQKPQLFQAGGNFANNKGIVNLIRWRNADEFQNFGPNAWAGAGTDPKNAAFNLEEGDTLKVSVAKKDGKYALTINGVESNTKYDLTGIADDGKAYLVISCSMKDSPADGFQYTITKMNGKPVVEAKKADTSAPATGDAGIALAALCVASLAGAVIVSKKLRRA